MRARIQRHSAYALDPDRVDTILYSEKGEVFCHDPAAGEQRPMAFQGFESDRGALKYRCPAAAYGFECKGRSALNPPPKSLAPRKTARNTPQRKRLV